MAEFQQRYESLKKKYSDLKTDMAKANKLIEQYAAVQSQSSLVSGTKKRKLNEISKGGKEEIELFINS